MTGISTPVQAAEPAHNSCAVYLLAARSALEPSQSPLGLWNTATSPRRREWILSATLLHRLKAGPRGPANTAARENPIRAPFYGLPDEWWRKWRRRPEAHPHHGERWPSSARGYWSLCPAWQGRSRLACRPR